MEGQYKGENMGKLEKIFVLGQHVPTPKSQIKIALD